MLQSMGSQRVGHHLRTEQQQTSVQFSSVTQSCPTLCDPRESQHARPPCPSLTPRVYPNSCPSSQSHHPAISSSVIPFSSYPHLSLEFTQTHVHRVSDAIQPSHPLSSPSPTPIFPSIKVFSNESTLCMRWPKYWSFSFNISSSNEHPGLISFRMDWVDLPALQGTLKSLLQQHISKASILQCSAFFTVQLSHPYVTVQLSHPYVTTGKSIALTRQTFAGKVVSLLF